MSLMNDMLRDLSKKQSANTASSLMMEMESVSWEQEKISSFFQYSRLPVFILSGLVFLVVLVLLNINFRGFELSIFSKPKPLSTAMTIVQSKADLLSVNTQAPADITPLDNNNHVISIPIVNQSIAAVNNNVDVNNQHIYELIDKASRAMTLDRLTSPDQDNAFFYYQALLKIDSQNSIAINGINKIVDRYLQMVDQAVEKNQIEKAEFFLEKAAWVNPADVRIAESRDKISSNTITETKEIPVSSESITAGDPFVQAALTQSKTTYLSVEPNSQSLDEQAVKTATSLMADGRKTDAISGLTNQISQYPSPQSEAYLLDFYYRDNNIQAMQSLLNANTSLSPVEQVYYQARIKVLENDNPAAIQLLESQLTSAESNENYRALLAGLYQREQLYVQATTAYRNLLQSFSVKPAYWLGLALSLDAQKQFPAASHAYRQLLTFNSLELKVRTYAQERINQLSREN